MNVRFTVDGTYWLVHTASVRREILPLDEHARRYGLLTEVKADEPGAG